MVAAFLVRVVFSVRRWCPRLAFGLQCPPVLEPEPASVCEDEQQPLRVELRAPCAVTFQGGADMPESCRRLLGRQLPGRTLELADLLPGECHVPRLHHQDVNAAPNEPRTRSP